MKKYHSESCLIEIKSTKTNSIAESAVKPHQLKALLSAQTSAGVAYKIPDTGHVRTPADAFILKQAKSFVVACFPHKGVCLAITPEKWVGAKFEPLTACEFVIDLRKNPRD